MTTNATKLLFCFLMACMIPALGYSIPFKKIALPADTTPFQYGVNPGYYGNGWNDTALAGIATRAGSHSIRTTLPDYFVQQWGYNIRLNEFKYYTNNLGMKAITLFIGEPSDAHVDMTVFPPATEHSAVFANMYTPIWDNGENGTPVNDNNYFALYVYNLVKIYGSYIKYWEIVNEPDFSYYWDNGNKNNASNWYDNSPRPADLPNLKAPVYYYIRMLRIANEVIKKYNPDSYVAPGGLGYPAFLDAMLRYTDNPDGGKVTASYPSKGGAYFDVVSYHIYPANNLSVWDNSIGGFRWFRNSDKAVDEIFKLKAGFKDVLTKYGYDGTTHPAKPFIITELNIPRKTFGNHYGGEEAERNFMIKAAVDCQKNDIQQFYIYQLSETADLSQATGAFDLMGLYENLKRDKQGSEKLTSEGKSLKTTSLLLYGWRYDAERSLLLNLPSSVGGAAFKKGDDYRYVLWAKTANDLSEAANAQYSFPPALGLDSFYRYEWDYAINPASKKSVRSLNIALTGTPSFFEGFMHGTGVLPVAIQSFTAAVNDCKVILHWSISSDVESNILQIEQSENGEEFTSVYKTVISKENESGSTNLELSGSGAKMYRLAISNADGSKTYSAISKVVSHCDDTFQQIMAHPNPVTDLLTVNGVSEGQTIAVFDNYGRKVKAIDVISATTNVDVSHLASSYYFLRIADRSGVIIKTIKFLKK